MEPKYLERQDVNSELQRYEDSYMFYFLFCGRNKKAGFQNVNSELWDI